jgi:tetratricopeptide (TPR) repeat protein
MSNDNQKFTRQLEDYIDKGKEAYKKHNYDYAIELFSHALKERQDLPEILHYLHLSKIKKLRENPPSILSKGAGKVKAQTYLLNAKKLASDGKYDKAIAEYEKALSIDALNANIFIKLGNLYLEKGEEDKAISSYQEAIEVNNNNLEALKQLGKLYKDKEEFDKAEQFFSKAKKIAPNDADVQKGLKDLAALQTIDAGKWEEQDSYRTKIKDEEEAKKLEKESKAAKTEEDIDYLIEEAEKDLKKDPENTSILFKLADLYKETKDYNKAQIIYEKII